MTIRLVARRPFTFQRLAGAAALTCVRGDLIEVTPIEAVLLRARGDAEFAPAVPATSPPPAPKRRRTYRRRDLVPED